VTAQNARSAVFEGMQQPSALDRGEPEAADGRSSEAFVAAHLPRVLRFATMVSPPGSDPEDLAQEAMVRALEHLDRFDPGRGTAEAWLWRIVLNLARDAGRLTGRSALLLERLAARSEPRADISAETEALDRMRDRDLLEAVRRLPRRHRSLIALRYGAGLTSPEIAELLGTTRMAVVKATGRALARLRNDLEVQR
jgi:RNA polymerase sigma factor (sigma-70 family)